MLTPVGQCKQCDRWVGPERVVKAVQIADEAKLWFSCDVCQQMNVLLMQRSDFDFLTATWRAEREEELVQDFVQELDDVERMVELWNG